MTFIGFLYGCIMFVKNMLKKLFSFKQGNNLEEGVLPRSASSHIPDEYFQGIHFYRVEEYLKKASIFLVSTTSTISSSVNLFFSSKKEATLISCSMLDEAILRCEREYKREIEDLTVIGELVARFHQEMDFYNHSPKAINVSVSDKHTYAIGKKKCMELLGLYDVLMELYPKLSNTVEFTLTDLEFYYAESKENHEKVLAVVERLLPEFDSLLRLSELNRGKKLGSHKLSCSQ